MDSEVATHRCLEFRIRRLKGNWIVESKKRDATMKRWIKWTSGTVVVLALAAWLDVRLARL